MAQMRLLAQPFNQGQNRGPADRAPGDETHEVHHWTQKFNCTAEQLRAAVP